MVQTLLDHMTLGQHYATKRGELPIHLGAGIAQTAPDPPRDLDTSAVLCSVTEGGHVSVVAALLEGKSDVDTENILGQTPLELAASEGHPDVCRLLIGVTLLPASPFPIISVAACLIPLGVCPRPEPPWRAG